MTELINIALIAIFVALGGSIIGLVIFMTDPYYAPYGSNTMGEYVHDSILRTIHQTFPFRG